MTTTAQLREIGEIIVHGVAIAMVPIARWLPAVLAWSKYRNQSPRFIASMAILGVWIPTRIARATARQAHAFDTTKPLFLGWMAVKFAAAIFADVDAPPGLVHGDAKLQSKQMRNLYESGKAGTLNLCNGSTVQHVSRSAS